MSLGQIDRLIIIHGAVIVLSVGMIALVLMTAPAIKLLRGDGFSSMTFSSDGSWLISGGPENTIWIRDIRIGKNNRAFNHSDTISCMTIALDGTIFAVGGLHGDIGVYDIVSGERLQTLSGHNARLNSVAFASNSPILVSASSDRYIKVWSTETWMELRTLSEHDSPVTALAFSPDGKNLVSAGEDGMLILWDSDSWAYVKKLKAHSEGINSVVFSPDGGWILSASVDTIFKIWNGRDLTPIRTLSVSKGVTSIAPSPDGALVAAGNRYGEIELLEMATGKKIQHLGGHWGAVESLCFSSNGWTLKSVDIYGDILLWKPRLVSKW